MEKGTLRRTHSKDGYKCKVKQGVPSGHSEPFDHLRTEKLLTVSPDSHSCRTPHENFLCNWALCCDAFALHGLMVKTGVLPRAMHGLLFKNHPLFSFYVFLSRTKSLSSLDIMSVNIPCLKLFL